jgi:hypothetical protein
MPLSELWRSAIDWIAQSRCDRFELEANGEDQLSTVALRTSSAALRTSSAVQTLYESMLAT